MGIVLYTFTLETGLAIIALVVLVIAQLSLIISKTRINSNRPVSKPVKLKHDPLEKKQKPIADDPAPKTIDPNVFSRFQENLNQTDRDSDKSKSNSDVILSISSKAKKNSLADKSPQQPASLTPPQSKETAGARQKPSVPTAPSIGSTGSPVTIDMPVEPLGSIFDDVQDNLDHLPDEAKNLIRPSAKKSKPSIVDPPQDIPGKTVSEPETTPIQSNEFLTSDDLKFDDQATSDDSHLITSVVDRQLTKGDYKSCIGSIRQYFKNHPIDSVADETFIELIRAKGECEFQTKEYEKASRSWQSLFKKHITQAHPDFLKILEEMIDKFVDENEHQHAVHFMFTALNEHRKNQEFTQMDEVYQKIETAYEQMEDWSRLIQTYQNHISIKSVLKDDNGQLELLDHLGKLLYDQGDAEGSRKCYEQRLAIENRISTQ